MRNGTNIPGATSTALSLGPLRLADNGNTVYCRAVNAYGATNSNTATVTVNPDTTPPLLSYVQSLGELTLVTVGFSEPIDPATAGNAGNYSINNGIQVQSAALLEDGLTVLLRVSPLSTDLGYILTVNNVRDRPNTQHHPGQQPAGIFAQLYPAADPLFDRHQ